MTEQEFSALFDGEDEALLGQLGESLRAQPALKLPADFARQTAVAAQQRFGKLPALTRLAVRLEPVMSAPIGSRQGFPWAVALLGGTAVSAQAGQSVLADLAGVLMGIILAWQAIRSYCLPRLEENRRAWPSPQGAFYLMPLVAALVTSIFCGGVVAALSLLSINFRNADGNSVFLGPLAGLAVFLYLLSALIPTWKALLRQSIGRPRWMIPVQVGHALWAGAICQLLSLLFDPKLPAGWVWAAVLFPTLLVSLALSVRRPLEEEGRPALWRALGKTTRSLVIGGLPIGAILVGAYQANLTRTIDNPGLYQEVKVQTERWLEQQRSIPAAENGWTALSKDFTSRSPAKSVLAEQLRQGGILNDYFNPSEETPAPSKPRLEKARAQFLLGLPAIEAAMQKPHFSYLSTQGFSLQSLLPNFILCRSVNFGLSGLAREALQNQDSETSLHYLILGLQWSGVSRDGSLINLMMGVSQQSIALGNVERWIFQARPNVAQLRRLLAALRSAEMPTDQMELTMRRNTYAYDQAFGEFLDDANAANVAAMTGASGGPEGAWLLLLKILPSSYWKSEHKAYLNLELARLGECRQLGRPNDTDPSLLLPFSFAARQFAPATYRAQAQFMGILTRFQALETVTALEIYQREHGSYPEHLNELVPNYLKHLPVDVISPNLWAKKPGFGYQRTKQGYQLLSESPVYATIRLKVRQFYGPDGNYQIDRAPQ